MAQDAALARPLQAGATTVGRLSHAAVHAVVLTMFAANFAFTYILRTRLGEHEWFIDLSAYAAGTHPLPFQYRALTSWLLRGLAELPYLDQLLPRLPAPFDDVYVFLWFWLTLACILLTFVVIWDILRIFAVDAAYRTFLAYIFLYMSFFHYILPYGDTYFISFVYDIPSLLLFTVCWRFLLLRQYRWFMATFVLALMNRETVAFLVPLLLLNGFLDREFKRTMIYAALCVVAFLAVKFGLDLLYGGNPPKRPVDMTLPGSYEPQVWLNVERLLSPQNWPLFAGMFGFLYLLVIAGWSRIERWELRGAVLLIVPWFGVALWITRIVELRVFGELVSVMAVAVAVVVDRYLRALRGESVPTGDMLRDRPG